MSGRRKYAKQGDRVKIIRPFVFLRCGYPMDQLSVFDNEDHRKEIERIVVECSKVINPKYPHTVDHDVRFKLEKAAVSHLLNKLHFGGTHRKVYETEDKDIAEALGTIVSKRIVFEGDYEKGYMSGGNGYYGDEPDWNPPYLSNAKAHCIYKVKIDKWFGEVEIDATNCEVIV